MRKTFTFIITLILLVYIIKIPVNAEINNSNVNRLSKLNSGIITGEIVKFVDGYFENSMKKYNIPGAVVSIVKDGKIVLQKGYGYADLENKSPVIPNKTFFRIGSVTKLFTADAIMQLVENKKVNLNEDINRYLGFRINNPYPTPVTVKQLLTHTSGMDSDSIGDLSIDRSGIKPLSQFLKNRYLPVIREPGYMIDYCNYGMAMVGCVVEEVSGISCADYISRNIFIPLGMDNTTILEMNVPNLAKGYNYVGGKITPKELQGYFNLYPVGGIISNAEDMSKFMLCHLNNGELNGHTILKKDTSFEMYRRQAGFDDTLPGRCYGFAEDYTNSVRSIGHGGYSPDGFLTELRLFTDLNMGIFVSVNQGYNNSVPQDFVSEFIRHYFSTETKSTKEFIKISNDIQGTYRFGEYTRSTVCKADIFGNGQDVTVTVKDDETIQLNETNPYTLEKIVLTAKQIKPLVFETADGSYIVFKKDIDGKVKYMAQTSDSALGTYERINWYDENLFQTVLFLVCLLIMFVESVYFSISFIKYISSRNKSLFFKQNKFGIILSGIHCFLNFSFFTVSMLTWGDRLRYGVPLDIRLLLIIPNLTSLTAIILTSKAIIYWKNKKGTLFFRINTTVVSLVSMIFIWVYYYWNFLGFKI